MAASQITHFRICEILDYSCFV